MILRLSRYGMRWMPALPLKLTIKLSTEADNLLRLIFDVTIL
jgi:hypothetical protein